MARNGDKLAWNAIIVCASILQRLWGSQKYTHTQTLDIAYPLIYLVKFRGLWCSKSLRCCGAFAESGWIAHMQKCVHVCIVSIRVYRLIFTKLSANVERLVGFITVYSNHDGLLEGRCYGNRSLARSEKVDIILWADIRELLGGSQDLSSTHADTFDLPSTSCKYFVNIGPEISGILWRVCRGWAVARK